MNATPVQPTPVPSDDPYAKLKKLAELRDAGLLTPEEFEAKKAVLLEAI